ncbi:toll-like receptor 4 [Saccostrea echinata]|uniref:toll-like receptor 4 n=1 Tax=Saccostrea echinata TaxID=191078 RepID=UPI002A7F22E0|nr:toll-like receptor 4 [Saccostrea echinata]
MMALYQWLLMLYSFLWISYIECNHYICEVCKCAYLKTGLKIDCDERLRMASNITSFPEETVWIDLRRNNIRKIKWRFPKKIRHIDLSQNAVSSLSGKPFEKLQFLEYLNLEDNKIVLSETNYYPDLFFHLDRLQVLNIKNNTKTFSKASGIDKAFSKLQSLETLKMDLPFNFKFGGGFKYLQNLQNLDVSGITGQCNIKYLSKSFFINIPFLKRIDLSNCKISKVDEGPFTALRHLEYLDISHNKELGFASLPNVTNGLKETSIRTFRADAIRCLIGKGTELAVSHIANLRQTKLTEASFAHNRIELIGKGVLPNMPKTLERLSFALNRLTTGIYLFEFHTLHNLKEFNITFLLKPPKYFSFVFEKCNEKEDLNSKISLSARYSESYFKFHRSSNITMYMPPNLETFYANSSKLYGRIPKFRINARSLKNVYAQNNLLFSWNQPLFGIEMLERVDLSNNLCSSISPAFTASGKSLKHLNMARNLLARSIHLDNRCQLFKNQLLLEELDLSSNRLAYLPNCIFQNMAKLKVLRLNHNQLSYVNFRIKHMYNLSFVDLSDNRINTFSDQAMDSFSYIFSKSKVIRTKIWHIRYFLYKHKRKNGVEIPRKDGSEISSLVAESDTLSLITHKFSYNSAESHPCRMLRILSFSYHAYISYVGYDRAFVFQKMKPKLEESGIKIFLRDIHFDIGDGKIHNIMKAISESRKTICVVSKAYLNSKWRTYEMNMAKMESIKERGSLGYVHLILMPDIFEGGCNMKIKDFIDQKYFIDYPPEDSCLREAFWEDLICIIKSPYL